ncbi:PREDICTED: uncharacterized protein LOC109174084 [Ipomoea nil]|uniref:uncharacterized protein LOC109174084 n=1 Tax=Ipomoea nil TaxID=35883 RepID=UPI000900D65B|nr:PREDICTED: uncharacterized protein LOC109174084 [Ipomoea nil]
MAICLQLNEIYWFDSIGGQPRDDIKDIVEKCVNSAKLLRSNGSTRSPKWTKVLCAQEVGSSACGYYVMKYMLEILFKEACAGMDKIVERVGRSSYIQQEIDQVRDVCADFFVDVVVVVVVVVVSRFEQISFVSRVANQAAHSLAKHVSASLARSTWRDVLPPFLLPDLANEI